MSVIAVLAPVYGAPFQIKEVILLLVPLLDIQVFPVQGVEGFFADETLAVS